MSLADQIASRTRRPTMTVWLNGKRWPDVLSASASQEYGQGIGSGTVVGRNPPVTPTPGMPIRWRWGYDGFEVAGFTGYIVNPERASYPNRWTLQCSDALWPAQRESQPIAVSPLNNVTARAAIEYILATYAGITRVSLPDIKRPSDSGTDWELGDLTPIAWTSDTTALAACQEIAQTAGYWLFADAGGTVRALLLERAPSDSPFRTFQRGVDLLVNGAPVRRQPADQVRNRITVRGANTGVEGAQLYDTYEAPHALLSGVMNSLEYQTFLLEYIADVTAVAQRIAGVWNRVPNTIEARIKADPRLSVGTTVGIVDSAIGYSTARTFFIFRLNTAFEVVSGRFDQQLTLDGGTGDAGFSTIPAPVAVITVAALEAETLDGVDTVIVQVDASASYSLSGGEIVSYAWATSGVTSGTPTSSSAVKATFIYPAAASPVTITLTVTDTTSKTDVVDLVLDLTGADGTAPVVKDGLSVAFGAAWEVTANGGETWNEAIATTTRVPPIGPSTWATAPVTDAGSYGLLASGSTALRQTLDYLATAPTNPYTAGGGITALSVNARNAARVWIAVGAVVYRSTDGGDTFTAWGTPLAGNDVLDIIEDPALDNSVFCLAGANMYQSTNPSAGAWTLFYAGPTGAVARWLQRSESGTVTWICYTGTFTGSPLQRVEGPISVTFPVVSPTVDEIRAIALMDALDPAAPRLIAIDQEARIWLIDGLTGGSVAQSAAAYPAGSIVQHAVASQQAPVVYMAAFDSVASGTGAVYKYFPDADWLALFREGATGRQAHMVGLAVSSVAVATELLLLPPANATGAADYIWYRDRSGNWVGRTPPQASWIWFWIAANPLDPDEWLLLGSDSTSGDFNVDTGTVNIESYGTTNSPLYRTTDAGVTWNAVALPKGGSIGAFTIDQVEFDEQVDGRWFVYGYGTTAGIFWVGSGNTGGTPELISGAGELHMAVGLQGELVLAGSNVGMAYLPLSASALTIVQATGDNNGFIDRLAGASRRIVRGTDGRGSLDYRVGEMESQTVDAADVGTYIAAATHGVYISARTGGTGILRIPDFFAFDATEVYSSVTAFVRSDRQTRTVVAARKGNIDVVTSSDGVTWTVVAGPAGLTGEIARDFVEVIVRGV